MSSIKRILPLLNRIVIKKMEAATKTASGIIVNKAVDTAEYGVVLEAGPGSYDLQGKIIPMAVKVGDKVLLPEFGGQKVKVAEQELFIYRDSDIIAKV